MTLRNVLEPMFSARWWLSWVSILMGCSIMAAGYVFFINPYNIGPGGVYGASIVMHNIFPSIQVGTFGYMFDIPLLILALVIFGGGFGARTIIAALLTPGLMNIMSTLAYPTTEALQALDPAMDDHNAIILVSDGGDLRNNALAGAEVAKKRGIPIFTVGLGDPRRETTLPDASGSGIQMFKGKPVKVKLEETALREIATVSGGRYVPLASLGGWLMCI